MEVVEAVEGSRREQRPRGPFPPLVEAVVVKVGNQMHPILLKME
jgi:hypothetical protein